MDSLLQLEPDEVFRNATEEFLNSLYYSKSVAMDHLDINVLQQAKDEFKEMLTLCNFNMNEIKEYLLKKGTIQPQHVQWFISILEKKSTVLLYQTLLHSSSRYGATLTNFDWRLKIVFGTSELKTMNQLLLQLTLSTINSNNEVKGKIFDVDKDVLKKLIDALESANVNVNT